MIKDKESFRLNFNVIPVKTGIQGNWVSPKRDYSPIKVGDDNRRKCPQCELASLKGMPGGKDSVCKNCGYKDPCCYD